MGNAFSLTDAHPFRKAAREPRLTHTKEADYKNTIHDFLFMDNVKKLKNVYDYFERRWEKNRIIRYSYKKV